MAKKATATPHGLCWDDCGKSAKPGSFFLQGHDKRADRYLAAVEGSQSIAQRLAARGLVPGQGSLRAATLATNDGYEECGRTDLQGEPCRVIGRSVGMRRHRAVTAPSPRRHRADDGQHGA